MAALTREIIGGKFKTLTLNGSDFMNGRKIGTVNKKYIRQVLIHDKRLLYSAKKQNSALIAYLAAEMQAKYPRIIQELRGMAEGARVAFEDLFLENCPELLRKENGCTSVAIRNKNGIMLIHNEDEEDWRNKKGFALLKYRIKDFSYTALSYPAELSGNAFGWNSAGLFYCVNYLATNKINLRGIPRYFVARQLLEKKTLASAIQYLRSADDASGFHYLIGDAKTGEIVSVEKSLRKISTRPVGVFYFHTNHYLHPKFKNLGKKGSVSSFARLKIIRNSLNKNSSLKGALKLFRTRLLRPLDKKDDSKTFATVAFRLPGDKLSK